MDDEREQIDQLRTWWSDYGNYVLAGVVIGAAGLFGANWYQSNRLDAGLEASNAFSALADAVDAGALDTAEALAGELTTNHPKSAYAAQARLAIARLYMDRNRDE
ncbi:MAG TPA: tetratricopeptide repeat protein, partial [Woeseiaceae bacterium]|nr:tetratricopeptide repeat protein [Woeseiaceae bacterium]